jgi:HlyD family secretion protein
MKKKAIFGLLIVATLGGAGYLYSESVDKKEKTPRPTVEVTRGEVVDKVLAIGTIEPENEISVKSKVSGVVSKIFVEEGDYIREGQALLEVRPDPTPLELAEAKQQVALQELVATNLKRELDRQKALLAKEMVSASAYDDFRRQYEEASLQLENARERLVLLEKGRVTMKDTEIESIIRAPVSGYLLTKSIEVGDPVTPLTSFQEGTVLMRMANMDRLIFKGTVDETAVGKLREGMEVDLKIGALPNAKITGTLSKVWLKSEKQENSTVFPVEIAIHKSDGVVLRAGYSANANIIIEKHVDVLMIPERVVYFRNDSAFVRVPLPENKDEEKHIETGLSNTINIEVASGLREGDRVLEKPVKEIK